MKTYPMRPPFSMILGGIALLFASNVLWVWLYQSQLSTFVAGFDLPLDWLILLFPLSFGLGFFGAVWFPRVRKTPTGKINRSSWIVFGLFILLILPSILWLPAFVGLLIVFLLAGSAGRYLFHFFQWNFSKTQSPSIRLSDQDIQIDYPWQGNSVVVPLAEIRLHELRHRPNTEIYLQTSKSSFSISGKWMNRKQFETLFEDLQKKLLALSS